MCVQNNRVRGVDGMGRDRKAVDAQPVVEIGDLLGAQRRLISIPNECFLRNKTAHGVGAPGGGGRLVHEREPRVVTLNRKRIRVPRDDGISRIARI